jgi:hypothetical protein
MVGFSFSYLWDSESKLLYEFSLSQEGNQSSISWQVRLLSDSCCQKAYPANKIIGSFYNSLTKMQFYFYRLSKLKSSIKHDLGS